MPAQSLRFYPLRFSFLARDSLFFPPGKSSNILRGAFGTILRRIACAPQCTNARNCEWRTGCAYARMFEPFALRPLSLGSGENRGLIRTGPSGLNDQPRPFVFRATHLDGSTVAPSSCFHFDLNLFDLGQNALTYLVLAFAQLAREGLGPQRGRVELTRVSQLDLNGDPALALYDNGSPLLRENTKPVELELAPSQDPVRRLLIRFLTPTELKCGQQIAPRPEFGIVAARARDRISKLRELYDAGPLDIDFRAFGERASLVKTSRCEMRHVDAVRRSSRSGQTHSIGGFTGEAEYEGDLAEFVPYLRAAQWSGIGRQTVWGKGQVGVYI